MDLGAKMDPPVKENARFYQTLEKAERIYANELVLHKERTGKLNEVGLHVGSNVVFVNRHSGVQKKAILFGDSFAEYRPHLLTGLLAETFAEFHFIWSTSIDYSYIDRVSPDIVITEIVERFMPQLPDDNFNLKAYVKNKLKEISRIP
jgi:hypothetical protein